MTTPHSKKLVIDASVARAAGGDLAVHPTPKQCRDFLKAVLEICHHVVLTSEISEEWKRHQSRFTRTWLNSMFARKKVLTLRDPGRDLSLQVKSQSGNLIEETAMLKDICLLEAALATDYIVVSLDDTARILFRKLGEQVVEINAVMWVNPCVEHEVLISWLGAGAPVEKKRQLKELR